MQIKFDANKKRLDTTPAFGLLVQGENLAESIQITGPKMVGALDLSQLRVAVRMTSQQYETTVEKTLEQTTDGDTITFTWQVDKQFTGSPGKVDVMLVGYGGNEEVIKITSSGMVVQEDRTFDTAPPESTWEQILQQMQDFATQAYESKTAAANSAAEAAASQKVAEEKAEQATNAASEAVKAAETAATDAAAQAAAKTEQQIRQYADDRYARPLVTKTGPAASLEVYPDKLSNLKVYANGFTTQAGTGDPSPTNVRALTNGGIRLKKYAVTGKEHGWQKNDGTDNNGNYLYFLGGFGAAVGSECICNRLKYYSTTFATTPSVGISPAGSLYMNIGSAGGSLASFKKALNDAYSFGNPYIVWYVPADESDATGLYAPIILTSGEYRATCLPLTAPLCEGDSVVSWAKSGCDQQVVLGTTTKFALSGANTFSCGLTYSVIAGSKQYSNAYPWSQIVGANGNRFNVAETTLYFVDTNFDTAEEFNAHITALEAAGTPIVVWYRSTNYTDAADIALSLETHQQAVLVLDGTENVILASGGHMQVKFPASAQAPVGGADSSNVCSHAKFVYSASGNGFYVLKPDASVIFGSAYVQATGWSSAEDCKAYLAAQYAARTPVTIVYQLATPITYAHEAVVLPALPDDTGKVTITGQSGGTVTVVFNKSIIKEIAEIKAAMLAMGANLSM